MFKIFYLLIFIICIHINYEIPDVQNLCVCVLGSIYL